MGGSSWGAIAAGVKVVAAVDMWDLAKSTYQDNISSVEYYAERCELISPKAIQRRVGKIQLLIASPECTSHSCARGALKASEESRDTAFQVTRFARTLKPRWLVVENVVSMRSWNRYKEWRDELTSLGYNLADFVLDSAQFGVSQARRRLFILGDTEHDPPSKIAGTTSRSCTVEPLLNLDGKYPFSPLKAESRAPSTLERANRAVAALARRKPFLLVYYGSDGAGGWQPLNRPLRTVTTIDRFALVRWNRGGQLEMRMLQVPELARAMGFPSTFKIQHGTRRDKIRLLGNAVCPPVMRAVVKSLLDPRLDDG